MTLIRSWLATLAKMFLPDLGLTLAALASVGLAAAVARENGAAAPLVLAAAVLAALAVGVFRQH